MKLNLFKAITILVLLLSTPLAHAFNCSLTSSGFATAYAPTGVVPNVTQGSFTLTCTQTLLDSNSMNYSVSVNNGTNPNGTQNRAKLNGNKYILYETYRDSGCSVSWSSTAGNFFTGTLNFVGSSANVTINYWGCITQAGQSQPAGTYTDSDIMTVAYPGLAGLPATATGTFPVTITNPATCTITSIANVAFGTYIAFRATPLVAPNSNIVLDCTPNLPYSLALDATSGVVSGLNYSLVLSASSSRGTGPGQTHTISGTMPANQAGTCATGSCTGSDTRTLTITY